MKDVNHCSKWSLLTFWNYLLHETNIDPMLIQSEIHEIVTKTIIASLPKLQSQYRTHCGTSSYSGSAFQLLGIDILLDENARPHLIEINRNPSLKCDTSLDIAVKTKVVGDLIALVNPLPFMPSPSSLRNEMKAARQLNSSDYRQWKAALDATNVAKRIKHEETIRMSKNCKWSLLFPSTQNMAKYARLLEVANSLHPKCTVAKRVAKPSTKPSDE
jgi:hypothetical protein